MAGLLVEWSPVASPAWERMRDDVARGGEVTEWHDAVRGIRIAATGGARIVEAEACVVALEGEVDDARGAHAIAAAYRRRGVDGAARVEGERAFVLWDRRGERLVLVPDATSRRTLAYVWTEGALLAASRVLPLLRDPRAPKRWDARYVAHAALATWAQPAGTTAFEGVRRVVAGDALVVEAGRLRAMAVAPIVAAPDAPARERDAYDAFRAALDGATRARMGQAPPCVSLSGGLDSGAVAASVMNAYGRADAFSSVGAGATDERALLQLTLTRYPELRWHPIDCTSAVALFDPPDLGLTDEPIAVGPAFQAARVRTWRAARDAGFRRMLDGEGGDELFWLSAGWGDAFASVRDGGAALRALVGAPRRARLVAWTAAARLPLALRARFARRTIAGLHRLERGGAAARRLAAELVDDVATTYGARSDVERFRQIVRGAPWVAAATMRRQAESALGLGLRSPLADRPLVELVLGTPSALRFDPRVQKVFLRRAMEPLLPPPVCASRKLEGLYASLQRSALASEEARAGLGELFEDGALAELVDRNALEEALADARGARSDAFLRFLPVCGILRLARWRRLVTAAYGVGAP